jgi:hypothetical protein
VSYFGINLRSFNNLLTVAAFFVVVLVLAVAATTYCSTAIAGNIAAVDCHHRHCFDRYYCRHSASPPLPPHDGNYIYLARKKKQA